MGLDTSHNCWHGSYSSFNNFRRVVANCYGFRLDSKEGFGGDDDWSNCDARISPFLYHSDCDGILEWYLCKEIAEALEECISIVKEHNENLFYEYEGIGKRQLFDKEMFLIKVRQFADGCIEAYWNYEHVDFH